MGMPPTKRGLARVRGAPSRGSVAEGIGLGKVPHKKGFLLTGAITTTTQRGNWGGGDGKNTKFGSEGGGPDLKKQVGP